MVSLAEACAADDFPARIAVVVSNVPDAAGLRRAADLGLATRVVDHTRSATRDEFEAALIGSLDDCGAELVCLAGFMRLLTPRFVAHYRGRLLNIHPSLLPSFPGLHAQRQALEYGVGFSGCTVHFGTEQMDARPIVLQAAVPVERGDTESALGQRILEQEHRIYPRALRLFAEGRLETVGRRIEILPR